MDSGMLNQGRLPLNLKKKVALAVRSIQWSYAIYWSISDRQPGVLEWGDGYYNGDIKTRKTDHSTDITAYQMDIQRSEQLRELFNSLAAGEANPHARRPSTALSPEDLTDTEWYYLVCMSFVFNIGQGLPGRTLADGRPFWLCNAHNADSKVFTRSLLAKSASMQTVVCFPFLGGVLELGVTDLVLEDPNIIEHIKASYLELPYSVASNDSNSVAGNAINHGVNDEIFDMTFVPAVGAEELELASPNSTNRFECEPLVDDSFLVEGLNGSSQVHSWQFMDDENSNCLHDSMDSTDCISQASTDNENVISVPKSEKIDDLDMPDLQEYNKVDIQSEVHYQSVLSSLLKSSHTLLLGRFFQICNKESSFVMWKKGGSVNCQKLKDENPQRLLKKVLFEVPRNHLNNLPRSPDDNGNKDVVWLPEADEIGVTHEFSDPRQKAKLTEKYSVLKSIIPSASKIDKISILDNTIEYLKELEKRVQELESCRNFTESEERRKRKPRDTVERTSDNRVNNKTALAKKPLISKRKACDTDKCITEDDNLTITMNDKDVLIEMKCTWRDGILIEILNAISTMHLDSHSVQSVTTNGILSLTIRSKFKGSNVAAAAAAIKLAIQRITQNC